FLGFVLSSEGLSPKPRKLAAIKDFPTPSNPTDVRRFLGLSSFFRRFILDFSRIAAPLTQLTRVGVEFVWTEQCENEFSKLKQSLCEFPVLCIFNPNLPIEVHTDASPSGLGVMLLQRNEDGKHRLVYCISRRTNDHESRYHSSRLEMLA